MLSKKHQKIVYTIVVFTSIALAVLFMTLINQKFADERTARRKLREQLRSQGDSLTNKIMQDPQLKYLVELAEKNRGRSSASEYSGNWTYQSDPWKKELIKAHNIKEGDAIADWWFWKTRNETHPTEFGLAAEKEAVKRVSDLKDEYDQYIGR